MRCAALMEISRKGGGGGVRTKSMTPFLCPSYSSFPHVLVFRRPPRHSLAPRLLFLFLSPLCIDFLSLLSFLLFFDTFWHHLHSDFGPKRAQKRDRWRDETERSRRQMEGEREDGRRRKEQSLLFLAAGRFYFILLYN